MIYFVAALIMKPEPVIPFRSNDEEGFYDDYVYSRRRATDRLKRRFSNLERRLQRMEDTVTEKEFDWENRLNS